MDNKPSYTELERQIKRLSLESSRLKAAEETFNRQNESLKALHETSLVLIDTLDKEELLQEISNYDALIVRSATKVTKEVIEAIRMLRSPHVSLQRFHGYFGKYPNNYGHLMLML